MKESNHLEHKKAIRHILADYLPYEPIQFFSQASRKNYIDGFAGLYIQAKKNTLNLMAWEKLANKLFYLLMSSDESTIRILFNSRDPEVQRTFAPFNLDDLENDAPAGFKNVFKAFKIGIQAKLTHSISEADRLFIEELEKIYFFRPGFNSKYYFYLLAIMRYTNKCRKTLRAIAETIIWSTVYDKDNQQYINGYEINIHRYFIPKEFQLPLIKSYAPFLKNLDYLISRIDRKRVDHQVMRRTISILSKLDKNYPNQQEIDHIWELCWKKIQSQHALPVFNKHDIVISAVPESFIKKMTDYYKDSIDSLRNENYESYLKIIGKVLTSFSLTDTAWQELDGNAHFWSLLIELPQSTPEKQEKICSALGKIVVGSYSFLSDAAIYEFLLIFFNLSNENSGNSEKAFNTLLEVINKLPLDIQIRNHQNQQSTLGHELINNGLLAAILNLAKSLPLNNFSRQNFSVGLRSVLIKCIQKFWSGLPEALMVEILTAYDDINKALIGSWRFLEISSSPELIWEGLSNLPTCQFSHIPVDWIIQQVNKEDTLLNRDTLLLNSNLALRLNYLLMFFKIMIHVSPEKWPQIQNEFATCVQKIINSYPERISEFDKNSLQAIKNQLLVPELYKRDLGEIVLGYIHMNDNLISRSIPLMVQFLTAENKDPVSDIGMRYSSLLLDKLQTSQEQIKYNISLALSLISVADWKKIDPAFKYQLLVIYTDKLKVPSVSSNAEAQAFYLITLILTASLKDFTHEECSSILSKIFQFASSSLHILISSRNQEFVHYDKMFLLILNGLDEMLTAPQFLRNYPEFSQEGLKIMVGTLKCFENQEFREATTCQTSTAALSALIKIAQASEDNLLFNQEAANEIYKCFKKLRALSHYIFKANRLKSKMYPVSFNLTTLMGILWEMNLIANDRLEINQGKRRKKAISRKNLPQDNLPHEIVDGRVENAGGQDEQDIEHNGAQNHKKHRVDSSQVLVSIWKRPRDETDQYPQQSSNKRVSGPSRSSST